MADLVYMTKSAWKSLLDAIRTKAGSTDRLTAATAKTAVDSIESASERLVLTDGSYLFYNGTRLSQAKELCGKLSSDTTRIAYMFYGTSGKKTNVSSDDSALSSIDLSKVKSLDHAFDGSGTTFTGTVRAVLSGSLTSLVSCKFAFYDATLPVDTDGTVKITMKTQSDQNVSMYSAFKGCNLGGASSIDFTGSDLSGVTDATSFFADVINEVPIVMPDGFLSRCNNASGFLTSYSKLYVGKKRVFKMPKGFMSNPYMSSSSVSINISMMLYGANYYKAFDLNSDFASSESAIKHNINASYMLNNENNIEAVIFRCSRMIPYDGMLSSGITPKIFVPSSMVYTYKAATNWSARADYIFAVEDYTTDGTIDGEFDYDKAGITLS